MTGTEVGTLRWHRGRWTRWSGRRWAKASYALHPDRLLDPRPLSADEPVRTDVRERLLERAVDSEVLSGADVLRRLQHGVILGYPRRVSHVMHFVLTILTGGIWGIVWLIAALTGREDRVRLEVDPWGNIWPSVGA